MQRATSHLERNSLERVVIVHGYAATAEAHWFPWLQGELAAAGLAATTVALPAPEHPDPSAWEAAVASELGVPDERTWVVAHSLGVITTLRVLSALRSPWSLGGLIAVAGFTGALASLPVLDRYLAADVDVESLAAPIGSRSVARSDADAFVPTSASDRLADRLQAELIVQPGAGHFLAEDGITELPLVLELLNCLPSTDRRH